MQMIRKGSDLENSITKKQKFENDNVFRKEINHENAIQIFENCKQNDGFYVKDDSLYKEIIEKYAWMDSNNSLIKLFNFSNMKNQKGFHIETSLINKFNNIIIIIFT